MLTLVVNTGDSKAAFINYKNKHGWSCPGVAYEDGGPRLAAAVGGGGGNYHAIIYPDKRYQRIMSAGVVDGLGLKEHECGGTTEYTLSVNSGTGDGDYAKGVSVTIKADDAPEGKVFDKWTGDIESVADVNSSTTTLIMPAENIEITAAYKDKEPVVKKDNYMIISTWEADGDDLGETEVTVDSSKKSDTIVTATLKLGKSDQVEKKWAWAQISGYADGKFDNVTKVELLYYSNEPVNLVLDQEDLSATGESYMYGLPAASRGQVSININDFKQPSWVSASDAKPLDLTKVISISFSAVTEEKTTNLEIHGIFLEGYIENTPVTVLGVQDGNFVKVRSISRNNLVIDNFSSGISNISIFNTAGKKIYSISRDLSKSSIIDFGSHELSKGSYIVRIENSNSIIVSNHIIK